MEDNKGEAKATFEEVPKMMILRFDQMDQNVDQVLWGASQPQGDFQDAITQTEITDFEAMGVFPLQEIIPQTDTPELKPPLEWARDMMLRFDYLNQILEDKLRGAPPSVVIHPHEQTNTTSDSETQADSLSVTFEEAIAPIVTANSEAIGDSFQDITTQIETSDLEAMGDFQPFPCQDVELMSPLEFGRAIMLGCDHLDQFLDDLLGVDAPSSAVLHPFEYSNTFDSETLDDSLSLTSEEAITPTVNDQLRVAPPSVVIHPPEQTKDVIIQTDTSELESQLEYNRNIMLRIDQMDLKFDTLLRGNAPPSEVIHSFEQTNRSVSETKSDSLSLTFGNAITQTVTTDFEEMPLSLHDVITQTDTPDLEAKDDSSPLELETFLLQSNATDSETGHSPRRTSQDLEVLEIPGLPGEESNAMELPVLQGVPVPQEVQEFFEVMMQKVIFVELMKLTKLLESLKEQKELQQVLQIVKSLEQLLIPMGNELMKVSQVQKVLEEKQEMPNFPKRPIVLVSPKKRPVSYVASAAPPQFERNLENCDLR